MSLISGSCLCQGISFTLEPMSSEISVCHCSQCRKFTGHQFATVDCKLSDWQLQDPENLLRNYRASDFASRGFCSRCGSSIYWQHDRDDYVAVLAGCLDGKTGLRLGRHIYVANKGDYYEISDALPQYEQDLN